MCRQRVRTLIPPGVISTSPGMLPWTIRNPPSSPKTRPAAQKEDFLNQNVDIFLPHLNHSPPDRRKRETRLLSELPYFADCRSPTVSLTKEFISMRVVM